ncbi:signal peptidase I [Faecalibaculum rodentium]|uniref:signal peptidase I n=1 Tax=Faecalibaculum rodentium TaxID=1702221 RepID=UPI003F665839
MRKKQKKDVSVSPERSIKRKRRKALDRRDLQSFLVRLVGLVLFIFLLFYVIFLIIPVPNDDMRPTLRARDLQLVYRYPTKLWNNDVVVYEGGARTRTGRIVARPGDTVEITEDDRLMVNGSVVSEGDIYFSTPPYDSDVAYPLTLGQDEYFILSDYREGAKDSRQFGPVQRNQILGKVLTVLRRSGL